MEWKKHFNAFNFSVSMCIIRVLIFPIQRVCTQYVNSMHQDYSKYYSIEYLLNHLIYWVYNAVSNNVRINSFSKSFCFISIKHNKSRYRKRAKFGVVGTQTHTCSSARHKIVFTVKRQRERNLTFFSKHFRFSSSPHSFAASIDENYNRNSITWKWIPKNRQYF